MALIWLPAPVSCTGTQSQAVAEQDVLQPLDWLSHTNSPPATQWLTLVMSALYGAMKRGFGSHGLETKIGFRQDGEIVEYAAVLPSDRPPLTVDAIERLTYSFTAWSPLAGLTITSPPSPPNGETMALAPGRSRPTPLSCMPPQMSSPPPGAWPIPAK